MCVHMHGMRVETGMEQETSCGGQLWDRRAIAEIVWEAHLEKLSTSQSRANNEQAKTCLHTCDQGKRIEETQKNQVSAEAWTSRRQMVRGCNLLKREVNGHGEGRAVHLEKQFEKSLLF